MYIYISIDNESNNSKLPCFIKKKHLTIFPNDESRLLMNQVSSFIGSSSIWQEFQSWNQKTCEHDTRSNVPFKENKTSATALDQSSLFHMGVSKNSGTPKSSISIRFSIINHPFWGTTIFGVPPISRPTKFAKFAPRTSVELPPDLIMDILSPVDLTWTHPLFSVTC